jgi:hypothetical protein
MEYWINLITSEDLEDFFPHIRNHKSTEASYLLELLSKHPEPRPPKEQRRTFEVTIQEIKEQIE